MKYRVKNKTTENFATKPSGATEATNRCKLLNGTSQKYIVVPVDITEKAKKLKPITENLKLAIKKFKEIRFGRNSTHLNFANNMVGLVDGEVLKLTDRQEAFVWALIYHYRAQVNDSSLIYLAKLNKI